MTVDLLDSLSSSSADACSYFDYKRMDAASEKNGEINRRKERKGKLLKTLEKAILK